MWSGNEGKLCYTHTHIGGGCVVGVYNGDVSCGFDWKVILTLITMFVTLLHMNSISHPTCKTGNFTRSHITCAKGGMNITWWGLLQLPDSLKPAVNV